MTYTEYSKRLAYLKEMISRGSVDSPHVIAEKWGCSEKTVRNMINPLREDGMNIQYHRGIGRYFLIR